MKVIFHSHHAAVSEHMRRRAERLVEHAAERIPRIVEGLVRFEEDGAIRRVTVTLRAPRHHELIGQAEGRYFGPALASALARLLAQARKEKSSVSRTKQRRGIARRANRARAADAYND